MRASVLLNRPLALAGIGRPADASLTAEQMQNNARRLIVEITWYGVLVGTAINLMQVYVVRLGAPSLLVGAVTYGPALISILWQIPAAQWMRRSGRRMTWLLSAGFLHRLGYLVVALLPWVMAQHRAEFTVAVLVVQALATTISGTSFLSMMADAIPADQVSQVVSLRMAGYGLSSTLSTLLGGLLLLWLPFPLNYQVLFIAGFAASMMSQWNVMRVRVPDRRAPVRASAPRDGQGFRCILKLPRFMQFVGIAGLVQTALGMVVPLLPLFAVRRLGASDLQNSLVVTMFSGSSVLGSLLMRRIVRRLGRDRVLAGGALGYTLYPLLLSLSPSVGWLIPWAALGGLFYAAISVTLFDNLLGVTPEGDRTTFVAVYNLFINVALFIGPLVAALVARGPTGPAAGLRLAAGVSLLAGLLCIAWARSTRREVSSA